MTTGILARYRGCLLGLAVGDAVGTTLEFLERGSFEPLTDMVGGGFFGLRAGQWTDDTSMALCRAHSLVACHGFDARDQVDCYLRWCRDGCRSSTGGFVDIGGTVAEDLHAYLRTGEPFSGPRAPDRAGNGCIMRLAPVALYFANDREEAVRACGDSSRTTHGARECVDASRMLGGILMDLLRGVPSRDLLAGCARSVDLDGTTERLRGIAHGDYRAKPADSIKGSGYVVECLQAALWCFDRADSFREAVLLAANLGDDADTNAAVCGQLAGAFWGVEGIPPSWRARIWLGAEIAELAQRLLPAAMRSGSHGPV